MKYKGKINYTMDSTHPNIGCVENWSENQIYTFEDVYTFDENLWSEEDIVQYIQHDLSLVASGGYDTKHIHNVAFEIERR